MLHASSPWQKLNSSREFIEGCKLMLENLAWKCLVWKLTFLQYCYSLYLSSQRGEGKAHASQYLDFCFQRIGFLSLSSSSLNPLPNEPLLLVGICCVFQVCGGEQRLRILVLCWYFLSQFSLPVICLCYFHFCREIQTVVKRLHIFPRVRFIALCSTCRRD